MAPVPMAQCNECRSHEPALETMAEIRIARHFLPWPLALPGTRARVAAIVTAGLAAGAMALGAMTAISVAAYDESPWKLVRMMAAIVGGPALLEPSDAFAAGTVMLGLAVHFALSILYTAAIAGVLRDLPREAAPVAGLVFGALLYAANLHGFTALFDWFAELRTADTFVAHELFGLLAASLARELERRRH